MEIRLIQIYQIYFFHLDHTDFSVVPHSIHSAVDKGCFYLNLEMRKCRLLPQTFKPDLVHMRSLIDRHTILLMCSYGSYPHGIIDGIDGVSSLCSRPGQPDIPLHIDGCLGGFVAMFTKKHQSQLSFTTYPQITSISADQHKFGLAPKGISTLFFRTAELRQHAYYINSQYDGGVIASECFSDMRNAFALSGAWYSLTNLSLHAFKENSDKIIKATKEATRKLRQFPQILILGQPQLCAFAFTSQGVNCFDICAYINNQKKWNISPIHKPAAIHLSVTLANVKAIQDDLANDVRQAIDFLIKNPPLKSATAALYGTAASLPMDGMSDQIIRTLLGATLN